MSPQDADDWDYGLWSADHAWLIAQQVRWRRKARGWSAKDLSDKCLADGFDIPRSTIADLENGRRRSVSVAELLAFARVLGVSPMDLVYPLELGGAFRVSRTEWLTSLDARRWWGGHSFGQPITRHGEPIKSEASTPEASNHSIDLEPIKAALAEAIAPLLAHIEGLTQALNEELATRSALEYALSEKQHTLDAITAKPPSPHPSPSLLSLPLGARCRS
jgi:transcriptional regulator with XRE-family HTH domain